MKIIVIRSVMFDSTVYGGTTSKDNSIKNYSFTVIKLAERGIILNYSMPAIKEELLATPVEEIRGDILQVYFKIVEIEFPLSDEITKIGGFYLKSLDIPYDDALIISAASVNFIDAILSWNRRHLVNQNTVKSIRRINDENGLRTPLILTPQQLIDKGKFSPESKGVLYVPE